MSNWPTRYRCRKCSRATSNYPIFCSRKDCPIKHDWLEDNTVGSIVGIVFLIVFFYFLGHT